VATRVRSNVRELEGALAKLVLYSSVSGKPITLAMAEHCLRYLNPPQERKVSIETIQRAVSEHFGLTPSHLKQKSNAHAISYPRQVAMYLCRELTQASLPAIGKAFGGKHHTTVLHAIQKIERLREKDQELNRVIQRLIDSIH
jgi:chromosomal replication initiator protein